MSANADITRGLLYPEIEAALVYKEPFLWEQELSKKPPATYVDLLEIPAKPEATVLWKEGIDHDGLIEHFEGPDSSDTIAPPVLRVLFVDTVRSTSNNQAIPEQDRAVDHSRVHPSTIKWMRDRFALSPIFVNMLRIGGTNETAGSSSVLKRDEKGDVVGIAGFYVVYGTICQVWFSHHIKPRSSTYIVISCPELAKGFILKCAFGGSPRSIGRLCAIDALMVDANGRAWANGIWRYARRMTEYETVRTGLEHLSPRQMSTAVEDLHHISQQLHTFSERLADVEALLEFLCALHRKCMSHLSGEINNESVAESLWFLTTRTQGVRRWAKNYIDRTDIRINLFYNLASQRDNRTNLDIANFTSRIAVETQRDSSSMITIAAVTMFFLPGTFVSALLSMAFFNSGTDSSGRATIAVSPQWWYFIAITIPLTIVVFFVWVLWQRWRNKVKGIGRTETYSSDETV